jgi:hypothetical protein
LTIKSGAKKELYKRQKKKDEQLPVRRVKESKKIKVERFEEICSVCNSDSAVYMALCIVCTAAEISTARV